MATCPPSPTRFAAGPDTPSTIRRVFATTTTKGIPHAFLVKSERAEYLTSFAPAGVEQFFPEVAPRVIPGEPPPPPTEPDVEKLARTATNYGIEIVGPPPTLD